MAARWRYRVTSVAGTAVLAVVAVWVANLARIQEAFSLVPYFGRPAPAVLSNGELTGAVSTTLVVVLAAMWPVFKPRPRRILDTILLTQKRVLLAMVALAALGYYNYSFRLPRSTLMITTAVLLVVLPAWMVSIRRRPSSQSRAVIVGDEPEAM
ncbi:exopolysaccharide biosynthesis polyprenyl glycosylphosphotransferase, partial [Halobacteriales archaeon QH_8_68_33]